MSLKKQFLREFTISLITSAKYVRPLRARREIIDSDLVPRLSDHLIMSNILVEKKTTPQGIIQIEAPQTENNPPLQAQIQKQIPIQTPIQYSTPVEMPVQIPIQTPVQTPIQTRSQPKTSRAIQQPQPQPQKRTMPAPINFPASTGEFGRITGLLADNTITMIECAGEGQNISILRTGQKQITNIVLDSDEIRDLLERIAAKARIPLFEGIFKAAVDNFMVNAVVSSSIGSRFVIRKQTPYSLLEPTPYD